MPEASCACDGVKFFTETCDKDTLLCTHSVSRSLVKKWDNGDMMRGKEEPFCFPEKNRPSLRRVASWVIRILRKS